MPAAWAGTSSSSPVMLYCSFGKRWVAKYSTFDEAIGYVRIPIELKKVAARLIRLRPITMFLQIAVRLLAPRHRVGVALVLVNNENKVLLLNHVFHPTAPWGLPGGWLDRGEHPAEGVLRELREETGLTARLGPVILVDHDSKPAHIALAYIGWPLSQKVTLSGEILEANWFCSDNLPAPLLKFVRRSVKSAFDYLEENDARL